MKRLALQILLAITALLALFRFGVPALIFGATGPGPFGNPWVSDGRTTTLLLDADLRFFGALTIGIGILFFWAIWKLDVLAPVIYVLASAIAVGAAARIYARIVYGNPGTAGTVPIVIETVLPIFIVLLTYKVRRRAQERE